MAKSAKKQDWPVGNASFRVSFEGGTISFEKIVGLKASYKVVEYRQGDSRLQSTVKLPVSVSYSDIVLKKGVFQSDHALYDWFNTVPTGANFRKTVRIDLMNEAFEPILSWTLNNAFPKEIIYGELDAMNASYAIEELVLTHEGMQVESK